MTREDVPLSRGETSWRRPAKKGAALFALTAFLGACDLPTGIPVATDGGADSGLHDGGHLDAHADGPLLDAAVPREAGKPDPNSVVVVTPAMVHQTMVGFGAADVFVPALTTAQAKLFFDPVNGIGLSILRVGIDVDGTGLGSGVPSDAAQAASYGAIVWGAPWSPPAAQKDNGTVANGGHLCAAAGMGTCTANSYDAWATTLAGFAAWLRRATGVTPYGISPQNEPDFSATYVSCLYTSQEMVDFVKVLGPKLAALTPPVKLIAPEPDNWSHLWGGGDDYGSAILQDPDAAAAVDILAVHDYGFSPVSPPPGVMTPIWETEVSGVRGSSQAGPSVDIANGVAVAQWIYNGIVIGGVSAWHYWWLVSQASNMDNEGLLFPTGLGPNGLGDVNSPPKRLYAMGNFSKFVRPGYVRVDVSGATPGGVRIVAFQSATARKLVVIAINATASDASVPVFVSGATWPSAVTPWTTSASKNLESEPQIPLSGGLFAAALPAMSVTTFVGAW